MTIFKLNKLLNKITYHRSSSANNKKSISLLLHWSLITLVTLTTGCDRESLLKEIQEFDNAVDSGANAIAVYYTSLNEKELELYFQMLELYPNCEVGDRVNYSCMKPNWDGQEGIFLDSPLKEPPVAPELIQARLNVLQEITAYSESLASLAGDDSPEQFQGQITALKDRLVSLKSSLDNNSDNNSNDPTITRYIDPISSIIGILGKLILEEKRWKEIQQSIIEAEEPVNTILDTIAEDLDKYIDVYLDVTANQIYTQSIVYYNLNRLKLSQASRLALLNQIREYKTAYDQAKLHKPSSVPNGIKTLHKALVKTAKSDGEVKDIAELKAALEFFKSDITQLIDAIKIIVGNKESADA